MKKCLIIFLSILFSAAIQKSYAQCGGLFQPVPLSQRVSEASDVIEARVISQQSYWNNGNIYTRFTLSPFKSFKGTANTNLQLVILGGVVDDVRQEVSSSVKLKEGDIGLFFLKPGYASEYRMVADAQGFIKYDIYEGKASDMFQSYGEFRSNLYTLIEANSNRSVENLTPIDAFIYDRSQSRANNPSISNINPSQISAGTFDTITISGSNFGSTAGQVGFSNANSGGAGYVYTVSNEIISWSDSQIVCRVPADAGTGNVRVVKSDNSNTTANNVINITYAHNNATVGGNAYKMNLRNVNLNGGIDLLYETTFNNNANAKARFDDALELWRCESGLNIVNGGTTTANSITYDGQNIVRFDTGDLASTTLGSVSIFTSSNAAQVCNNTSTPVFEMDISWNADFNWNFGTGNPSGSQYDFKTVVLHELGHAHLLGHVIDSGDVMHYNIGAGDTNYNIGTNNGNGANDIMDFHENNNFCGTAAMSRYEHLSVNSQPQDQEFCSSGTGVFTYGVTGATNYQWQINTGSGWSDLGDGGPISGSSTNSLSITYSTEFTADVRCNVSGDCGSSATSDEATYTVSGPNVTTPSDTTACVLGNATMSVTGTNVVSYQWQNNQSGSWQNISNGSQYNGVDSATLQIATAPASLDGVQFRCVGTSSCGTTDNSNAARLTLLQDPVVTITTTDEVCGNDGTMTLDFQANNNVDAIEFSLDGGNSYVYSYDDESGSQTITGLLQQTYPVWVRWEGGLCPIYLGDYTINTGSDNEAPVVITQDITVSIDQVTNIGTITAQQVDNGSTDNCGIQAYSLDRTSFSCADFGTNTVTLTVSDINGNAASATAVVTVNDAHCIDVDSGFITTWTVSSGSLDIEIPVMGNGYNYIVDWGDGTTITSHSDASNKQAAHTYSTAGTYTVKIGGNFPRIHFNGVNNALRNKLRSIQQWGNIQWTSMEQAFFECSQVTINAADAPDLSAVTSLRSMFFGCDNLGSPNLNSWDVSTINDFSILFRNTTNANPVITDWDVSNGTTFTFMFLDAAAFSQNLGNWDISNATNLGSMLGRSGMSVEDYDSTLTGWATLNTAQGETAIPTNLNLGAQNLYFCDSQADRNNLINNYGWNVGDEGQASVTATVTDQTNVQDCTDTAGDFEIDFTASPVSGNIYFSVDGGLTYPYSFSASATDGVLGGLTGGSYDIFAAFSSTGSCATFIGTETISGCDSTPPTASCKDLTVSLDATGNATITSTDIDNGSTDDVGITNYTLDIDTFDCTMTGNPVTVTLTVEDAAGNTDTCQAIVTVLDESPPTLNTSAIDITLDSVSNSYTLSATDLDPIYNENCGNITYIMSQTDFFCSNVGINTVTITATDENNNSLTQDLTVNVNSSPNCINTATAFITTWETMMPNETITIPTNGLGYDYTLDWGDGTVTYNNSGDATHTYTTPGTHTIMIQGQFPAIYIASSPASNQIRSVEQWGNNNWQSFESAFQGSANFVINATDTPDLGSVNSMVSAFESCISLGSSDLSQWNISNVTNLTSTFANSGFTGDISTWNTASVNIMDFTFENASSFNHSLADWNVSAVFSMLGMLNNSGLSLDNYDATLEGWATLDPGETQIPTNVTLEANNLQYCASAKARQELIDDYNWSISNDSLTLDCYDATDPFITTWETTANNQSIGFRRSEESHDLYVIIDWGDGDTSTSTGSGTTFHTYAAAGTYTVKMYGELPRFHQFSPSASMLKTVEQWGTNEWKSFQSSFIGCTNLQLNATDAPDLSQVNNLSLMFTTCTSLDADLSNWDVSNVQNFNSMFENATSFDQSLASWDLSSATDLQELFKNAGISTANYDATLIGWATDSSGVAGDGIDDIPSNITFHGGSSIYCAGAGARQSLIDDYGWTITDGGLDINACYNATDPFVTTWETTTSNEVISIYSISGNDHIAIIDWGDGSTDIIDSLGTINHTYAVAGTYVVKIYGEFLDLTVPVNSTAIKMRSIEQWGTGKWLNLDATFFGALNLVHNATDSPDLSNTTSVTYGFSGCENLNMDVSNWNVKNIQTFTGMFSGAIIFNQDLGNWDLSNAIQMDNMLDDTALSTDNYDATLIGWAMDSSGMAGDGIDDIPSNITLGAAGLYYCSAAAETARQTLIDTYGWTINDYGKDISCYAVTDPFVTTWETTTVNESIEFFNPSNYGIGFTVDWGDGAVEFFNTSGVKSHIYNNIGVYNVKIFSDSLQFATLGSSSQKLISLEQWGTVQWISLEAAFLAANNMKINATDIPNISDITSLNYILDGCYLADLDVSNWNVSNISGFVNVFNNAETFNQNLGDWDITNAIQMNNMLTNSGLSTDNYDATLIGWATDSSGVAGDGIDDIPTNITLGAAGLHYCSTAAQTARQTLINTHGWTINDAGLGGDFECGFDISDAFIYTMDTKLENGQNIITWSGNLLVHNDVGYDFYIDWGDGTVEHRTTGADIDHVYAAAGTYTIKLYGEINGMWFGTAANANLLRTVEQWGTLKWLDFTVAFDSTRNMIVNAADAPDFTEVTSISNMFLNAENVNTDFSHWDTSSIEFFQRSFNNAISYDQSLGDWDISSAIKMHYMLDNTALSTDNYDATLIGWATDSSGVAGDGIDDIPSNITLGAAGLQYCSTAAEQARNTLINTYGWTITDAGRPFSCFDASDAFVTTWETTSANQNITYYMEDAFESNYYVDWGDGSAIEHFTTSGQVFHSYQNPGIHTVKIYGSFGQFYSNTTTIIRFRTVEQWGTNKWKELSGSFTNTTPLILNANDAPDITDVTNVIFSFGGCSNLNSDISHWDFSNVQNFEGMFYQATSFDQNLGDWDISSATNMSSMFLNAGLSTANYDATLIGWATDNSGVAGDGIDDIPSNITFDGGNSTYCNAAAARDLLINTYGWTITDAGLDCGFDDGFITKWQVIDPAIPIVIPTTGMGYDYRVDWGDGTITSHSDADATTDASHTYATAGTYTIKIAGDFPRIFVNGDDASGFITEVVQWGNIAWTSFENAFEDCDLMTVTATDAPYLNNVSSMERAFEHVTFGVSINHWDVSNISNMTRTFRNADLSASDISNWDVKNVETMESMLGFANFNGDISGWQTWSLENTAKMFIGNDVFNQDLSGWDMSQVTDMSLMFVNATAFDQDLGTWDLTSVTDMTGMLANVTLSTANYDATLRGWATDNSGTAGDGIDDVPSTITFNGGNSQYCDAISFRESLINSYGWIITDGGNACDFDAGFITTWQTTSANESITIPTTGSGYDYLVDWGDGTRTAHSDADATTDASHTYATAGTYTVRILGDFPRIFFDGGIYTDQITGVTQWGNIAWTSFENAFDRCTNLSITATDAPDLSNVTSMSVAFREVESFTGDTSSWNVSNITDIFGAFALIQNFTVDLSTWNVSNVSDMSYLFFGTPFNGDITGWNTSAVTTMASMFSGNSTFNQDISGWDTSNVSNYDSMFSQTLAFDQSLGNWDISSATQMSGMFLGVTLSRANYDAILQGWTTDSSGTAGDGIDDVPINITFDGGNSTYCIAETERNDLINTYSWTITDGGLDCGGVQLAAKVFLQGAMTNPNAGEEDLMRDHLWQNDLIPLESPYGDGKLLNEHMAISDNGDDNVVDWVWVELRNADNPTVIIDGQSAILQRDGDIVDTVDGSLSLTEPLTFNQDAGNYYVVIKHRSHLGIMSASAVALSVTVTTLNFTDANNQITYGTNAQSSFAMPSGKVGMWAGNTNGDNQIKYAGPTNDSTTIKDEVVNDSNNLTGSNLFIVNGYSAMDIDMETDVVYQGPSSDAEIIKDIIRSHPENQLSPSNFFIITEQLPELVVLREVNRLYNLSLRTN